LRLQFGVKELWADIYSRACFNVHWCTKCAVMNENVQRWEAIFAAMNDE